MPRSKRTIKRRSTIAQRERRIRHAERTTDRIAAMFGQYAEHIHRQNAWDVAFADQMVNGG